MGIKDTKFSCACEMRINIYKSFKQHLYGREKIQLAFSLYLYAHFMWVAAVLADRIFNEFGSQKQD